MSPETPKPERYVVRSGAVAEDDMLLFRHPFNANSEIRLTPLSDRVGMQRMQLSLGRIQPGRESFVPHSHTTQEEFIFILSGQAEVEINGERTSVGPGDYVGFPIDGAVHQLYNTGDEELVYLMGGERTSTDMSHFPSLNKIGIWAEGTMRYVDAEVQQYTPDDFVRRNGS